MADAGDEGATVSPAWADDATLKGLRCDMLRFAELQLRDRSIAEDVVQEAIEAALAGARGFAGRAALKTWIFAILRNKIIDHLRRGDRTVALVAFSADGNEDDAVDALFNERGHWRADTRPSAWADPEAALSSKQFWAVFEACLDHLPESVARVFAMRELLGLDNAEICATLGITSNNCNVILHRARLRLRNCLEGHWFETEERPSC